MNNHGKLNLGDEIKNIVQEALNNKDFNKLNKDIKIVVNDALEEVRKSINLKNKKHVKYNNSNTYTSSNKEVNNKAANNKVKSSIKPNDLIVPVGKTSGLLLTIFGSIGSSVFGLTVFVLTLLGYSIGARGIFHTVAIGLSPFLILSIISVVKGSSIRKRLKRAKRYILNMENRDYCLIDDLSLATGLSKKFIEKDLSKMIHLGIFPQGHIDDKKTSFMLNDEIYQQYLELKKHIEMKDLEKSKSNKADVERQDLKHEDKVNKKDKLEPEIRKVIDEGRNFVSKIKQANTIIPGEEISFKLDQLEEVTGKIFDYVELHPEKFPEIKKFTEYFLPTTLKLVDTYTKLDSQPVQGVNIISAKKEIEETMDTINLAFTNLLDDLFYDIAMDISTDISVLETMFAQEGLTGKNIRS